MQTDITLQGEEARKRFDHVAVRLDHYIVVFGGSWWYDDVLKTLPLNVIWMYNLYTEQWSKHGLSAGTMAPPPTDQACAAVLDSVIYVFGGRTQTQTNALWKLVKTTNACFEWSKIEALSKGKSPSPRCEHSGWEYDGQLWTFGGSGGSPIGFLNHHGDYDLKFRLNNQLLCFDPTCEEWMNPKCSGYVPPPIAKHATTIITDNVWQFGGYIGASLEGCDELYKLNMSSLFWTKIEAGYPQLHDRMFCSFTALTNTYLVLHGGYDDENDNTWILDLSTLSWKKLKFVEDLPRSGHTCTRGINSVTRSGCWGFLLHLLPITETTLEYSLGPFYSST